MSPAPRRRPGRRAAPVAVARAAAVARAPRAAADSRETPAWQRTTCESKECRNSSKILNAEANILNIFLIHTFHLAISINIYAFIGTFHFLNCPTAVVCGFQSWP